MRSFWFFTLTVLLLFFRAAAQDKKPNQFIGRASYYADKFHGRRTANGERFDMNAFTAAHRSLPFGTRVKVTNLRNQKSVVLRINDRGPYIHSRIIDVSRAAAKVIGLIGIGSAMVSLQILDEQKTDTTGPTLSNSENGEYLNTSNYQQGMNYDIQGNPKASGGFGFQVGVFTDLISAREKCQQLLLKGEKEIYLQIAMASSEKIYRILIREFSSREAAEESIICLKKLGMKGFVRAY